jgi:phosphatidylinositol alpha-mannosyltransferase
VRVGIISPYSLTLPGGVQGQVLGLARSLRRRGLDVRVLGPCDGPPPGPAVTPLGNSLPTAANGSVAPIAPDPAAQLRTIRALWDEEFDVIHLHEPIAPGPTMTALVQKTAPTVGTFHAAGGSLAYRYLHPVTRKLADRLDHRCVVSDEAGQMARSALGGEYEVLFNGVEVDRFANVDPWPADDPTIFFLGRHEPRKGLAVLIEAVQGLPHDVRVWIAGEGPETEPLMAATAGDGRFEWLGRLDDREKVARLRGAHAFCAPSLRGESFGVVLLEAMAAGTAIVASELVGYSRVARAEVDAVLVPPGDAKLLGDGLRRVLDNDAVATELVNNGYERADRFSMVHLAEEYERIYSAVGAPGSV